MVPDLERHVECDDHSKGAGDDQEGAAQQVAQMAQRRFQGLAEEREELGSQGPEDPGGHAAHQQDLQQGFAHLDRPAQGQDAPEATQWVEAAEVRPQALEGEQPAAYQHRGEQRHHRDQQEQRRHANQRARRTLEQALDHLRRFERRRAVEGEGITHDALQAANQRCPEDHQPAAAGEQNSQRGKLRGARDLTPLARLLQAPL